MQNAHNEDYAGHVVRYDIDYNDSIDIENTLQLLRLFSRTIAR